MGHSHIGCAPFLCLNVIESNYDGNYDLVILLKIFFSGRNDFFVSSINYNMLLEIQQNVVPQARNCVYVYYMQTL